MAEFDKSRLDVEHIADLIGWETFGRSYRPIDSPVASLKREWLLSAARVAIASIGEQLRVTRDG